MKLRNKKTGEIGELVNASGCEPLVVAAEKVKDWGGKYYNSLAELNEDWEDYEEPKKYWYIDADGNVMSCMRDDRYDAEAKAIGNYFETRMGAERVVEKLKAFKRLKDKGFGFESWFGGSKDISFWIDTEIDEDIAKDLDLLFGFGGEDE